MLYFEIQTVKPLIEPETTFKGHSRSLAATQFNTPHVNFFLLVFHCSI